MPICRSCNELVEIETEVNFCPHCGDEFQARTKDWDHGFLTPSDQEHITAVMDRERSLPDEYRDRLKVTLRYALNDFHLLNRCDEFDNAEALFEGLPTPDSPEDLAPKIIGRLTQIASPLAFLFAGMPRELFEILVEKSILAELGDAENLPPSDAVDVTVEIDEGVQ